MWQVATAASGLVGVAREVLDELRGDAAQGVVVLIGEVAAVGLTRDVLGLAAAPPPPPNPPREPSSRCPRKSGRPRAAARCDRGTRSPAGAGTIGRGSAKPSKDAPRRGAIGFPRRRAIEGRPSGRRLDPRSRRRSRDRRTRPRPPGAREAAAVAVAEAEAEAEVPRTLRTLRGSSGRRISRASHRATRGMRTQQDRGRFRGPRSRG